LVDARGLRVKDVGKEEIERESRELGAMLAIPMTNGSVIVFKKETRKR
jgi:hypothetical protein